MQDSIAHPAKLVLAETRSRGYRSPSRVPWIPAFAGMDEKTASASTTPELYKGVPLGGLSGILPQLQQAVETFHRRRVYELIRFQKGRYLLLDERKDGFVKAVYG